MPTARVNGVALHHALTGDRPPLVLVHGSCDSHADRDPLLPLLATSFRVLAYARRGHARSERPLGHPRTA